MKKLLLLFIVTLAACIEEPEVQGTDAPIDAPIFDCIHTDTPIDSNDPCAACGPDQICVQRFDGVCTELGATCEDRAPGCTGTDCQTCDIPHCRTADPGTFTCAGPACGTEIPGALHCYGV